MRKEWRCFFDHGSSIAMAMSYKRADEILPENILEILQNYVSGEAIYVPKKMECRKRWGSSTGVNEKLRIRNEQVFDQHRRGASTKELALQSAGDTERRGQYVPERESDKKERESSLSFFVGAAGKRHQLGLGGFAYHREIFGNILCAVLCNQKIFHAFTVKILPTFFQSHTKAGGGEGVRLCGGFADDGNACQFIVHGIPGGGVEDMMIEYVVFIETAFIDAGSHHGEIPDLDCAERCAAFGKGFLDADAKGRAVRSFTDGNHIAAKTDTGAFHTLREQVFFQFVGDIAFGDKTEINGRFRVA